MQSHRVSKAAQAAVACCIAATAITAGAQQAGVYEGSTSDGHPIQFSVVFDATSGQYVVDHAQSLFTFNCQRTDAQEIGLGLGASTPVDGNHVEESYKSFNFYLEYSATFINATHMTGKVRGALAEFLGSDTPPRQSQVCKSDNLRFTATLSSAVTLVPRAGAQTTTMRDGKTVVQTVIPAAR